MNYYSNKIGNEDTRESIQSQFLGLMTKISFLLISYWRKDLIRQICFRVEYVESSSGGTNSACSLLAIDSAIDLYDVNKDEDKENLEEVDVTERPASESGTQCH